MTALRASFNALHLHPLFFATVSLIAGIALHEASVYTSLLIMALIIGASCCYSAPLYSKITTVLLISSFFLIGTIRIKQSVREQAHAYTHFNKSMVNIVGTVHDIIGVDHPLYKEKIMVTVQKIMPSETSEWQSLQTTIALYTKSHKARVGDQIFLPNIAIKKSQNNDFERYLAREGIAATCFLPYCNGLIVHRPLFCWQRFIFNEQNRIMMSIKKKLPAPSFNLFSSIFLGNKSLPKEPFEKLKDHFNTWGITHYLARSGLHVIIFIALWHLLGMLFPMRFGFKQLLLISLTAVYALLSWPSVSFNRALGTFILYKISLLLRRPVNVLHIFTLVCIATLATNPWHLFFLDFQLSFLLTFALILFNQCTRKNY